MQTSTIVDLLKSAVAIGEGTVLPPESHRIQLAPVTAAFPPLSKDNYYAYGHMVSRGWIILIPSFSGYAAMTYYLPARKLAIAISVTVDETADPEPQLFDRYLQGSREGIVPDVPL